MKQKEKQARLKNRVTTLLIILLVTVFFKKWGGTSPADLKGEPAARKPAGQTEEMTDSQAAPVRAAVLNENQSGAKPAAKAAEKNSSSQVKAPPVEEPQDASKGRRAFLGQAQNVLPKSRLLELYPEMKGEPLLNVLGKMSVSDFPAKDGSVKNEGLAEDGTTVVEYETPDGSSVTQWYSEDGSVGAETIQFSDQEKITRWFAGGGGPGVGGPGSGVSATMVQYDNGQKGGLLYLDEGGGPKTFRTWRSESDPETRVDF